ncbi:response regulator [Leptolyngbya sp. FACHB-261]|uniref:hybrid sensor histidine kinase/response regulator n=1 Tax=Leptolyngbya sp. FACHB-261 TaxID=2692806 RepID=UPI001687FCCE|nr:response regulator [Leptolyngbya sp. FACHB-261]MBD2102872.1 hybrid sensor histidine kinase/response regulator [Leptolyngbya sp. FACHB-261]
MAIDSDIRKQAYQFFVQEAPELLQVIEQGLLSLTQDRSIQKVHTLMRAAHSIKGGAASVGSETIKEIAHRLEDSFKALYDEDLQVDPELEDLLFKAYDCLRLPLIEGISTGRINKSKAVTDADQVFSQLEAKLGDFLNNAANLPSSVELGVDIAQSIFEVDVAQGLERLEAVLADPHAYEVAGELCTQAEVFSGLAELLNLPGFQNLSQTAIAAVKANPDQAEAILGLALADFQQAQQAVLAGDRTQGGSPSEALLQWLEPVLPTTPTEVLTASSLVPQFDPAYAQEAQDVQDVQDTRAVLDVFTDLNLDLDSNLGTDLDAVNAEEPAFDQVFDPAFELGQQPSEQPTPQSVRVDLDRLDRLNNLVGELAINQSRLSLQNKQLRGSVQALLKRFANFQQMGTHLRHLSDQTIVSLKTKNFALPLSTGPDSEFDQLEMDSYSQIHSYLQSVLEEVAQLAENTGDVALFADQTNHAVEKQRQTLTHLRDDLMWARMLPLSEILETFPRTLRDMARTYGKPVDLKLSGTRVLVDKAALEKLRAPLLHLLRNAFDHGIEPPQVRQKLGKPVTGQITIHAYHQGSQTVIEVRDDGQGINLDEICRQARKLNLLPEDTNTAIPTAQLYNLIFEPGFSTASQVSDISGRGIGLDVVRSQIQELKGSISINSEPQHGTAFTIRLPLTLTIAKLLIFVVNSSTLALPLDSVEEIIIPKPDQIKTSGGKKLLHWRGSIVPVRPISSLLTYTYPFPESAPSQVLVAVPAPSDWASPLLLLQRDSQFFALEIDRLITEQELVIKPFGSAMAPPPYIYGCTILGDGSLIPVVDTSALLSDVEDNLVPIQPKLPPASIRKAPTVLVVDDSVGMRQTLTLALQKVGYRVLQARDGREALEHLRQTSEICAVICDVEMPNMNGFEFLTRRRQNPELSKIPVAMLTSRSSQKHQRMAMLLGASAYLTKPCLEQELAATLETMRRASTADNVPLVTALSAKV